MLSREKLVNIILFMEQAPHGTGGHARAWAQTLEAVHQEIDALSEVKPAPRSATEGDL